MGDQKLMENVTNILSIIYFPSSLVGDISRVEDWVFAKAACIHFETLENFNLSERGFQPALKFISGFFRCDSKILMKMKIAD